MKSVLKFELLIPDPLLSQQLQRPDAEEEEKEEWEEEEDKEEQEAEEDEEEECALEEEEEESFRACLEAFEKKTALASKLLAVIRMR